MTEAFERDLGGGLVLRSVRDERDIERFVQYQFEMFHNTECVTVDRLLRYHPDVSFDDFLFVEDTASGRIASTTCFVPFRFRYDDVELKVAQLEVVATHPDYRRRGLVREQIARFHELADQRGYEMTAIGGIPYYYRQFGYTYAVDQGRGSVIPAFAIPDVSTDGFRLRPATEGDVEALTQFYDRGMGGVGFHDKRPLAFWHYLMRWAMWPAEIVERVVSGEAVGYISAIPAADGAAVYVSECGISDHETALVTLGLLKARGAREVIVSCPPGSALARLAASLGAALPHWYQWLLRIADLARFLSAIAPVLERRLEGTSFAALTGVYRFNNFRQAADVVFRDGRVVSVSDRGFVPHSNDDRGGEFVLPPDAFVRLVVGYRTLTELRDGWPDIVVPRHSEPLLEVLFPPMQSFMYLPYSYRGPVPDTWQGALSRVGATATAPSAEGGQ